MLNLRAPLQHNNIFIFEELKGKLKQFIIEGKVPWPCCRWDPSNVHRHHFLGRQQQQHTTHLNRRTVPCHCSGEWVHARSPIRRDRGLLASPLRSLRCHVFQQHKRKLRTVQYPDWPLWCNVNRCWLASWTRIVNKRIRCCLGLIRFCLWIWNWGVAGYRVRTKHHPTHCRGCRRLCPQPGSNKFRAGTGMGNG